MSAVGYETKVKTWTPAVPCKIPDNIVSSQFAAAKVFVPSYEKEKRPCMDHLLTNEYQRIWWQEKETWDKMFDRKITTKQLLQRMIIRRQPPTPAAKQYSTKSKKPKKKKQPKKLEETTDIKINKQSNDSKTGGNVEGKTEALLKQNDIDC